MTCRYIQLKQDPMNSRARPHSTVSALGPRLSCVPNLSCPESVNKRSDHECCASLTSFFAFWCLFFFVPSTMTSDTTRAAREVVQTRQAPAAQTTAAAQTRHGRTRTAAWTYKDGGTDGQGRRHGWTRTAARTDKDSGMDGQGRRRGRTRMAAWMDEDGGMDGRGRRHGRTRTAARTDEDGSTDRRGQRHGRMRTAAWTDEDGGMDG